MPTTLTVSRLEQALDQARHARHHPDCMCALYRDAGGAPYCTADEARWQDMVNRILTTVCRETSNRASTAIHDQHIVS